MFLGTCLYVYFKVNPDPQAAAILAGTSNAKAESILPYFCVRNLPTGVSGLVITGILAAAMSASSSSVNAISAVTITDFYRRHFVKDRDERHYVKAARWITAASAILMMGGAVLFLNLSKLTLQDTGTKIAGVLGGGILGLYVLGFLSRKGDGRAVAIGIAATLLFSTYITAAELKWITTETFTRLGLSEGLASWVAKPIHTYYAGIFGNIILFAVAYGAAVLIGRREHPTLAAQPHPLDTAPE
jgi:SSS family solute:Na+ symporter